MKQGRVIIFSAPSGSGKSTIINYLMEAGIDMHFSISATSRPPRGQEQNGVEYFFLSPEEFRRKVDEGAFLEWMEVYEGRFYGTLKSEVDNSLAKGENVVCDVDVIGAKNIKKVYGNQALSVFVQPPSIDVLRKRLEGRGTDAPEVIAERIARAEYELSFASEYDVIIVNDDLAIAQREAYTLIKAFLEK